MRDPPKTGAGTEAASTREYTRHSSQCRSSTRTTTWRGTPCVPLDSKSAEQSASEGVHRRYATAAVKSAWKITSVSVLCSAQTGDRKAPGRVSQSTNKKVRQESRTARAVPCNVDTQLPALPTPSDRHCNPRGLDALRLRLSHIQKPGTTQWPHHRQLVDPSSLLASLRVHDGQSGQQHSSDVVPRTFVHTRKVKSSGSQESHLPGSPMATCGGCFRL